MKLIKRPVPELGNRRTVIRFAWLPVKLDDGWIVWMEKYAEDQIYDPIAGYGWIYYSRQAINHEP